MSSLLGGTGKPETSAPEKEVKPLKIPAFSDIAKAANDLLSKEFYHTQAANLEVKTKAPNGVNFLVKGKSPHEGGDLTGSLEAKKQDKANGITGTLTWNTANTIDSKLELENTIAKDVKVEALHQFKPNAGTSTLKANTFLTPRPFHCRAFFDLLSGPKATFDTIASHNGFLAGGEIGYDVQKAAITKYSLALGYQAPEYSATAAVTNGMSLYTAAYYHKVSEQVQVATKASFDNKTGGPIGLELASKYQLDPLSFAKVKVDNKGIAAVAYNTKVKEGFTLGLGASFDTQKINEGSHKIGAHFAFEG